MDVMQALTRVFELRVVHEINSGVYSEQLHGHNMKLEVSVHPMDVAALDKIVKESVVRVLDLHQTPKEIGVATGENIVEWIDQRLRNTPLGVNLLGVALQETRKNRFVSRASNEFFL